MAKVGPEIRDRIKEFRRVPAAELQVNPRNMRRHPASQRALLSESLQLIGIADSLTAYYSPRNAGRLTLIDGEARLSDHRLEWPVLILDVSDEEADLLLATLDPITNLAENDLAKANALLDELVAGSPALDELLDELRFATSMGLDQPSQPESGPELARVRSGSQPGVSSKPARGLGEPPDDLSGGLDDTAGEEVWVPLATIFGQDRVPAAVAGLLAQVVRQMLQNGDLGESHKWQAIEYVFAEYAAAHGLSQGGEC